ncbi:MAG TPA: alkaline phosphatase family protein [Candidatus Cybelea sp.]|jgi:phospholipase C
MGSIPATIRTVSVGIVALLLAACGGASLAPSATGARAFAGLGDSAASGKIRHIIIIIQENRSFNNLFYGFPGATTTTYGYNTKDQKITLQPVSLDTGWDLDHSSYSFFAACNGTGSYPGTDCLMNGFNKEAYYCGHYSSEPPCPNRNPPYSYVPHSETKPYFYLGRHYVLADEMYASNFDASSFISHQYIIAGQAKSTVNYPYFAWGCSGGEGDDIELVTRQRLLGGYRPVCWDTKTIGDEMDDAGLSWAFYASQIDSDGDLWSAYQNIKHIYNGPDWQKDVISPQTRFFDDVAHGKLRALTWITPTCANSDHAGCQSKTGPSWVASLVNAVGESKYWDSSAIFIFWDDYGGWFDPKAPALKDYDGLGLRIPLLVVSPYAKAGHVSHVHYEHGSILKFVEDTFGLARLAASDRRATSPENDAFDFNRRPRKFVPVPAEYDINYFKDQPLDRRVPDSE